MKVTAKQILDLARAQIGTKATNIKKCIYNTWFYGAAVSGSAYDWCETFVQWLFNEAGASSLLYTKTANCGAQAKAFFDKGKLVTSGFKAGDVVFFHWSNDRSSYVPSVYTCDHVGIIEQVNADGTITTIEGNTGSSSNGEVMRRVRSMSVVSCAGRPAYASSDSEEKVITTAPEVLYRVRAGGKWLKEVNNASSYAGEVGKPVTDVAVKVTSGKVRYRVHIKGGSWLPYVTGYDICDHENGYAGDMKPIDAVEIYYYTPSDVVSSRGCLRAKYRVSALNQGYYPYQYDNEKDKTQDGYAGLFGKSFDRLQISLAK